MHPELTKIIADYLAGELNEADRKVFEERLKNDPKLQEEVAFQKTIVEAAKRSSVRTQVAQSAKGFHLQQTVKWSALTIAGIVLVSALTYFIYKNSTSKNADITQFKDLIEQVDKNTLISNLAPEYFAWNGKDTAMLSKNGILISIPESAFLLNGKPYTEPALIQFQEALDAATIVKAGLSTTSNGKLLETQGMFSFKALSKDGELLTINPKTGIYVQVPVDEYKDGMQLFSGVPDKNGIINWVNPKPLAKIPVPIDMEKLNFYPPGYEDSLNTMKLSKSKKYRDSLYLSCEEEFSSISQNHLSDVPYPTEQEQPKNESKISPGSWKDKINWTFKIEKVDANHAIIVGTAKIKEGWHVFSVTHDPNKADLTGYPTKFIFNKSKNYKLVGQLEDGMKPQTVMNELGTSLYFEETAVFKQKIELLTDNAFDITLDYSFQICDVNGCIFPPHQTIRLEINGGDQSTDSYTNIPPSNVLAFWKPKFNNTLLATHDFEKRMQAIHGTCNKKVLEVYTKNLGKSMVELDRQVVQMGYSNFEEFAAENIGALYPNNPHIKGLQAFYEKGIAGLQNEVNNYRKTEAKRREKWDKNVNEERMKESNRTIQRENQAFCEEYNLNHKNVRKQLGRTLGAVIYTNASVSNIDRFVLQTTLARKTGEFYDKETGKTARIQYNDFSFDVDKPEQYELVYAYLFPSKLNSYQRISGNKGKFSYALNDAILYDLAIVAISEKGYSYFQKSNLNEGNLGTIKLERVSEAKVNASIEQLNSNRISKPMRVADELSWLKTEQQNYVERRNRQNAYLFHERIKKIVFPCYEGNDNIVIGQPEIFADSIDFFQ
ncbi:MAG: hypothetical protein RI922_1822 [Bacteroidota bacterium]|jgi:hypothetical protein